MSLVSLPRKEVVYDVDNSCSPAKVTLTFRGTTTAPLAKSIDPVPPPKTTTVEIEQRKITKAREKVLEEEAKENRAKLKKKVENMKRRKEEFLEKGVMTALYGAVEQKVKCACMSTDHLLVQKQTRLRELLLAEEVAYTTEYISMWQVANTNREEELRKRAFELEAKHEAERKKLVDQKLLEHVIENYDAARPVLTQKHLMEVKKDQLWQIKEKYALEEAKREEDKMYHDLMIKNMLALKENEEEAAKLVWIKQKETQKAFQEQLKWKEKKAEIEKQLKEQERIKLEEEIRLIKEEKEKEKMEKIKRREEMKGQVNGLLAREKEIKERRKREEEEIDMTFARLMRIEEEKEKRKEKSEKARLKREMDIFLEKSRELKRQKEEEEIKLNRTLQELNDKKRQLKDAERRKLKAAREELFSVVLKGREEQIRAKREREKREEEQKEAEIKLLTLQMEQQDKIRADYERRCAQQREEYRLQLLRQIKEVEETRRRKQEEEDNAWRMQRKKEEMELERVKAILKMDRSRGTDHPMKTIFSQLPPKYPCP